MDQADRRKRTEELEELVARTARARDRFKIKARSLRQRLRELGEGPPPEYRQLRRRWKVPVHQPMLLVSQVQRAGGTLLNRLFDGHPECFSHPVELKWGRPAKWDWPSFDPGGLDAAAAFALVDETWVDKLIRAGGYSKYSQWTLANDTGRARLYPFVFDRQLEFEIFEEMFHARTGQARRPALDAYLTALFNAWLDYQNLYAAPKRWVTAFVPRLVMHQDSTARFFADYPDGLLVTVIRHPGSWFASASRHNISPDPADALPLWQQSTGGSLDAVARYGDRVIVVMFEDLVLRTEEVMRRICARAGLTFSEILTRPTYNGMPVLSDSSFALATDVDPRATQRHEALLTREQMELVERLAMDEYRRAVERHGLAPVS